MRYLKIFSLFFKNSLMMDLEYRANFIFAIVMSVFEVIWSAGAALVLYSFTDEIGGWSFYQTLVVVGLLFIAFGLLDGLVWPSVIELQNHIQKGTLDFVLTKPFNSQLHATLRRYRLDRFANLIAGFVLITYALAQLRATPDATQIALFALLVLSGLLILYGALTLLVTIAFWAVETDAFGEVIFALLEIGRYPASALPEPVRAIVTFIIPIALITTVPAEVLLGKLTSTPIYLSVLLAALLLFLSHRFWNFAVRHYSSASS
jgi:ABC-2 type transport system permease protein